MGIHSKEPGLKVIDVLSEFGNILGYYVKKEEPMFYGKKTSSELDITWKKDKNAKFPLFIFEVESYPLKSASDNVLKVFSRKTPLFQKPLFFFHVFVDKKYDTDRINYLSENYDKQNYKNYLLNNEESSRELIKNIIEQHLRIENHINLYPLIFLMNNAFPIKIDLNDFFEILTDVGYDKIDNANFLMTLELAIVNNNIENISEFYLDYLKIFLSYPNYIHQNYDYILPAGYSEVIHNGIHLLMNEPTNEKLLFDKLLIIEKDFEPFELWAPYFGLSYDHDIMLLSEFPLLLTLLSVSFKKQEYSIYFNNKLAAILKRSFEKMGYQYLNQHGLVWLIIASRVTKDENNYNFAKDNINDNGGIDKDFIINPTFTVCEEADERFNIYNDKIKIPDYKDWNDFLNIQTNNIERNILLKGLLESFLTIDNFEFGRKIFAKYCLHRSLQINAMHELRI